MDKKLSAAILHHVKSLSNVDDELIERLSNVLGIPTSSATDIGPKLCDIFVAGVNALSKHSDDKNVDAISTTDDNKYADLFAQPKFRQFIQVVTGKGYFAGLEKGSTSYNERLEKAVANYKRKFGDTVPAPAVSEASPAATTKEDGNDKLADKLKTEGNKFLEAREFEKAVDVYTKAIEASPAGPNSHIYYSNRAAGYQHLQMYEAALEDCAVAISLMPGYAKAHARAAKANYSLGRNEETIECAKTALEFDQNNAGAKLILQQIEAAGTESSSAASTSSGGMPDFGSLMANMDPNMMDKARSALGGGGMPDIGSLMNNPAMMQMAQQLASNPDAIKAAQNMMKNPDAMNQMMSMMGGAGGKNMDEMMNMKGDQPK